MRERWNKPAKGCAEEGLRRDQRSVRDVSGCSRGKSILRVRSEKSVTAAGSLAFKDQS